MSIAVLLLLHLQGRVEVFCVATGVLEHIDLALVLEKVRFVSGLAELFQATVFELLLEVDGVQVVMLC